MNMNKLKRLYVGWSSVFTNEKIFDKILKLWKRLRFVILVDQFWYLLHIKNVHVQEEMKSVVKVHTHTLSHILLEFFFSLVWIFVFDYYMCLIQFWSVFHWSGKIVNRPSRLRTDVDLAESGRITFEKNLPGFSRVWFPRAQ